MKLKLSYDKIKAFVADQQQKLKEKTDAILNEYDEYESQKEEVVVPKKRGRKKKETQ